MTLTVRLNDDEDRKLQQIVQSLHVSDRSSAIRELIEEKWRALQSSKSFVERRGGHPVHLLQGASNASDRDARKRVISDKLAAKTAARKRVKE
jgi:hypothetical protein